MAGVKTVEDYFPFRGPCAFCGDGDARHRMFDAITGMYDGGMTMEEIADALEIAHEAVRLVIER